MSLALKVGLLTLNFCGWVCILASTSYNQNKVGSGTLNFPVDWRGAYNARTSAIAKINWETLGMNSISYAWWITCFQIVCIVLGLAAVTKPAFKHGVSALFAVLTTTTFLYTANLYNAPNGIFSFSHDQRMNIVIPTANNVGSAPYSFYKGLALMFAGLIICDVCNALLVIVLPLGEEAEQKKPQHAEAPNGEKDTEMTTAVAV